MDVDDEYIPEDVFAECLGRMPQPCVDLVVELDGGIVLARRTNDPARGEWFWPGSRLYRGEDLTDAVHRIAHEELGIDVTITEQLGTHSHFWETSSVEGLDSRHTVAVVYRVEPAAADPEIRLDDQHSESRVLTEPDPDLHEYVRLYLEEYELLPEAQ
jgi:colanic acid biosynthesis protein WcaH